MESYSEKCLALTDADLSVAASVYATIDYQGGLVIEYRLEDDRHPRRNFTKRAIVDSDDAISMARHYSVEVKALPQLLDSRCGIAYASTPSDVEYVFGEALNIILDAGVRYRIKESI